MLWENKEDIRAIILSKKQGDFINVKTATGNYWGDFNEYKNDSDCIIIDQFNTDDTTNKYAKDITSILIRLGEILEIK